MSDTLMQRYSEVIIEHSQFPRHHGKIENFTHQGHGENPFCGDRITLQLRVNNNGIIDQAVAESVGCAISMASASLMATYLHGLNLSEAQELFTKTHTAILKGANTDTNQQLGDLAALSFAGRYPSRVKCATLPWHVLKHALEGGNEIICTE
jgi:nitrogen fixation NifU-like protein